MHADPETDTGADADVDAGTHRAAHGMMLKCFPALAASISRRAPDQVQLHGTVIFTFMSTSAGAQEDTDEHAHSDPGTDTAMDACT